MKGGTTAFLTNVRRPITFAGMVQQFRSTSVHNFDFPHGVKILFLIFHGTLFWAPVEMYGKNNIMKLSMEGLVSLVEKETG